MALITLSSMFSSGEKLQFSVIFSRCSSLFKLFVLMSKKLLYLQCAPAKIGPRNLINCNLTLIYYGRKIDKEALVGI
jgi:hypothetical protein